MLKSQRVEIAVALLFGVCTPWAFAWLTAHAFTTHASIVLPLVVHLNIQYGWTLEEIRPYSRTLYAVLSSVTNGLGVGFVLGLLLTQRWFLCWLAFAGAYLVTACVLSIGSPLGVGVFLATWLLPESWLMLGGTLLFAFIGHRIRDLFESRRAVA
jgi:hypothetical protein